MAFADAFFDGQASLTGVTAIRVETASALAEMLATGSGIPFLAGTVEEAHAGAHWHALVDARMRKRARPEDARSAASLVIGLGPGFVAEGNCHVAVETSWDALGELITTGSTRPLRGEPRPVGGAGRDRTVRAPADGVFRTERRIGDWVSSDIVGALDGTPILAPLPGVLRGLIRDGVPVRAGAKLVEVDPRGNPALCFGLGERPKRIALSVLGALRTAAEQPLP
jgi:xanthine dehydrogenase accessory factor